MTTVFCGATTNSLSPIISTNAVLLILGTMPGIKSLERGQYYSHPQNTFWDIMEQLCGAGKGLEYDTRVHILQREGVALWDVLEYCDRTGSLDSKIRNEKPNDFNRLLRTYPNIKTILFNGKKAEKLFRRHVWPILSSSTQARIVLVTLPSTSPANTQLTKAEKIENWLEVLRNLS
jgi:hypoxanthine-DNA glycosylase